MHKSLEELIPIESAAEMQIIELEDEGSLVMKLAITPLDPAAARAYARKKYLVYALILIFSLGLPLGVFSVVSLQSVPLWLRQAGIIILLGAFFIFFYVMIAMIMSRHRILKNLGLAPVQKAGVAAPDVQMLASRHGRILECGFSQKACFWRYPKAATLFRAEYRGGLFYASATTPEVVRQILAGLPRNRLWKNLCIEAGPQGVRLSRPIRMSRFSLYDLWLLEKILEKTRKHHSSSESII